MEIVHCLLYSCELRTSPVRHVCTRAISSCSCLDVLGHPPGLTHNRACFHWVLCSRHRWPSPRRPSVSPGTSKYLFQLLTSRQWLCLRPDASLLHFHTGTDGNRAVVIPPARALGVSLPPDLQVAGVDRAVRRWDLGDDVVRSAAVVVQEPDIYAARRHSVSRSQSRSAWDADAKADCPSMRL